jgi:hypothetical protein
MRDCGDNDLCGFIYLSKVHLIDYVYILGVLEEKAKAVNIELQNVSLITRAAFPAVEERTPPRPAPPPKGHEILSLGCLKIGQ